jgi:alkanesulfonate monooxygenase SsuD/methylene tetrahydromethanopterin reductase-like flavin-dependent oxidoreductase (luciferase family)
MTLPAFVPGVDGPTTREWCRRIEDGPYDALAVGERVAYPSHDLVTSLAFAAAATRRVRLVSTIVVLPSHDAVRMAKQAATIDVLSEGRLTLGVGVGGRAEDYLSVGVAPTRRFAKLDEQVATMRAVWRGESVVDGIPPIGPAPVQAGGPPLLTASMGPKSLARSARWADGLAGFDLGPDPASVAAGFDAVRAAWADAGRTERPWLATSCWFALGDDAEARLHSYARNYLQTFGDEAAGAMASMCRLDEAGAIRDTVAAIAETGADEFTFVPTSADPRELDRLEAVLADVRLA